MKRVVNPENDNKVPYKEFRKSNIYVRERGEGFYILCEVPKRHDVYSQNVYLKTEDESLSHFWKPLYSSKPEGRSLYRGGKEALRIAIKSGYNVYELGSYDELIEFLSNYNG